MRISYDPAADALSIVFRETTVTTQDIAEGISAEYDEGGLLVGLEILDATARMGGVEALQSVLLERVGPAAA